MPTLLPELQTPRPSAEGYGLHANCEDFYEQRRWPRENVHFLGWIDVGNGAAPRECTVLDVSEGGARIVLAPSVELPKEFHLVLSKQGTRRHCRLAWRADEELGVAFLGPPSPTASREKQKAPTAGGKPGLGV